ncbi:MAG: hypothetical protein IKN12_05560 [Selenomonadaceae bacterium]|nr:hypothetical protein [Selenomonadaceae bacterium]MBR3722216.1 hypothetical protein [Selenomonadaceae bacterium]
MKENIRIHPETGEILKRDIRPVKYSYKGESIIVDVPGWYPATGNDGILTREDCKVGDAALQELKSRHEKKQEREDSFFAKSVAAVL